MHLTGASLSERIAEELINQIATGQLKPGDRLVESKLLQDFGTSQAPVREALVNLEHQGFVVRAPRKGTEVRRYTIEEVRNLYEVRYMLESHAAKKAMQTNKQTLLDDLADIVSKMTVVVESEYPSVADYQELNRRFHFSFFSAAGNNVLTESYHRVYQPLTALRRLSVSTGDNLRRSYAEHQGIFECVKTSDVNEALEILDRHHDRALLSLEKLLRD